MAENYNRKSPGVKRIMREVLELQQPTEDYYAQPLDDNLFEWHFTIRGPHDSEFEGGVYHGRIQLPSNYPMSPPFIIFTTPNGRFEVDRKICLSISGHHPETWQPSWSIRTALTALIAFMPTSARGTIGSLDYTPEERKILAKKSKYWACKECGLIEKLLYREQKEICESEQDASIQKEDNSLVKYLSNEIEKISDEIKGNNLLASVENSAFENNREIKNSGDSSPREVKINTTEERVPWNLVIIALVVLIGILMYRRWNNGKLLFL